MACRSASVKRVADKTVKAKQQVDKLQAMIQAQEAANKKKFYAEIESHLASANITDARELSYNSDIKTEYTSEFSLDKIAAVVTSSLKAVSAASDPTVVQPAMSAEAIDAYVDVVNTVAQAAKSSSTASASLSFSMNRLSPGMFGFLYASSVSIQEEETFGSEAVTSTAIYYRLIESIDDVKHQAKFDAALIDKNNYLHMKTLQAGLTDDLAQGKIDITTWMKLDDQYSAAVAKLKARLDADQIKSAERLVVKSKSMAVSTNHQLVLDAVKKLSAMGDIHKVAIERSQARIASSYY
ncbi:hypothetical protein [Aquimarina sp. 2304DJ70-9]|uniref:hypothetical protein n=1 Tax=Aquimarina penaris TaxID=3231044 RepID=UPI0034632322